MPFAEACVTVKLRTSDDARSILVNSRVERWQARMRESAEWISLADIVTRCVSIAEWRACETGSVSTDAWLKMKAYRALYHSLIDGDFEENGRSRVVYPDGLFSDRPWLRMTRDLCEAWPEDVEDRIVILNGCWVHRDLARCWFEDRRIPLPSWLLVDQTARGVEAGKAPPSEVIQDHAEDPPPARQKHPGGRPPKYQWAPVLAKLRRQLEDYGAPAEGDGGQAVLERFVADQFPPDDRPATSTIREKVRKTIEAYRHFLEKGVQKGQ
jgi:hypothetical protein